MFLKFLFHKHECHHNNVPLDVEEAYCPDCGELIRNQWFLVRCSCCNIKRTAHSEYNEIKPDTKYCHNCGGSDFYIQELDNVKITDVKYAVFKKTLVRQNTFTTRQVWIEQEENLIKENKLLLSSGN